MTTVFLVHLFCTVLMTGFVWFAQVVQYPLLGSIEKEQLPAYIKSYMERMFWLASPIFILEAFTGIWLLFTADDFTYFIYYFLGAVLLMILWGSTFLVQRPLLRKLIQDSNPAFIRELVQLNWVRTAAWTVRMGLLIALLSSYIEHVEI